MNKTLKINQIAIDKSPNLWYNTSMKNRINKLDKTRRLIKLSPDSDMYKAAMKRDNLGGSPDIYQSVGMDWRSVQDAMDMTIDIDEFFDNHLPNQKRDPAWDNFDVVNGHFIRKS